jgi:hypothetical protein
MQIGIDSFVINAPANAANEISTAERMSNLLEEIAYADRAGLDVFGIGEHHRHESDRTDRKSSHALDERSEARRFVDRFVATSVSEWTNYHSLTLAATTPQRRKKQGRLDRPKYPRDIVARRFRALRPE